MPRGPDPVKHYKCFHCDILFTVFAAEFQKDVSCPFCKKISSVQEVPEENAKQVKVVLREKYKEEQEKEKKPLM